MNGRVLHPKDCFCNDSNKKEMCICDICNLEEFVTISERKRKSICPCNWGETPHDPHDSSHGGNFPLFKCGSFNQHACQKCQEKGWLPQAAIGGPVHYIENTITGERKYNKDMISTEPF